jgi:hypothetical protein
MYPPNGTKTNMTPLRGWAPRGERLLGHAPFGHWNTMTFVAALRADRVSAPWIIDGSINGKRFLIYVEKVLVPELNPGDIVVMDNLGSHKARTIRVAIRKVDARLFLLPQYSPDLNPIEKLFFPRSSMGCARRRPEPDRPSTTRWQKPFKPSRRKSAKTTSRKPDMNRPKTIPL